MLNQGGWRRAFPQQLPPVLPESCCRHSSQALLGETTAGEGQDSSGPLHVSWNASQNQSRWITDSFFPWFGWWEVESRLGSQGPGMDLSSLAGWWHGFPPPELLLLFL